MPNRTEWYGQKVKTQTLDNTRRGVNAVTKKIAAVAAGNLTKGAGVDRGKLKRNIKTLKARRSGAKVIGKVGPTRRAWYGKYLESGAKKHAIAPKVKGRLAWRMGAVGYEFKSSTGQLIGQFGRGKAIQPGVVAKSLYLTRKGKITKQKSRSAWVFAKEVEHPGMRATHFLSKAVSTVWPDAPGIIAAAARSTTGK